MHTSCPPLVVFVFPACAGVILDVLFWAELPESVPRMCGGDPTPLEITGLDN